MRCRNCHTVMMESDLSCPTCHASAASATAAAPGPISSPSGMSTLLPIFGGAIGGALYGALNSPAGRPLPRGAARAPRSSNPLKWTIGLLLILGGGLFLPLALVHVYDTWDLARREPQVVTAAELRCTQDPKALPAAWIAYTFEESKPTELTVTRRRLGLGGDVQARCLLLRVEDKWLIASVAVGFEGNRLVGRLLPLDAAASHSLLERIRRIEPDPSALLPYEFNAVDGSASDQRLRYMGAAWCAFFGLLGLLLGVRLVCGKRRPAEMKGTV